MAPCDEVVGLRRSREDDARAIAQVHVDTWRATYRSQLPAAFLDALSVDNRERMWRNEISVLAPDRRPWVAETQTRIIGFVVSGTSRDEHARAGEGEVYAIYVLPECWSRGIGRNLLAHAERDLRTHGYGEAILWCLEANARARAFYEQLGWHQDGATEMREIGGREVAEVRYRKALERSRTANPS